MPQTHRLRAFPGRSKIHSTLFTNIHGMIPRSQDLNKSPTSPRALENRLAAFTDTHDAVTDIKRSTGSLRDWARYADAFSTHFTDFRNCAIQDRRDTKGV
ncbi:hypothetical protein D9611_012927 [Ephemerocybe angulata]|uniref:Uncharacterized protein n=1 Tax=Ephemerocybe angulata TaxID=980116 RepID=A0A8H5FFM1_9AGAR|nr:hypothetical protein D9611_012927 [Tulosesus angulatus]